MNFHKSRDTKKTSESRSVFFQVVYNISVGRKVNACAGLPILCDGFILIQYCVMGKDGNSSVPGIYLALCFCLYVFLCI